MCRRPEFNREMHKETIMWPSTIPETWHFQHHTVSWVYLTLGTKELKFFQEACLGYTLYAALSRAVHLMMSQVTSMTNKWKYLNFYFNENMLPYINIIYHTARHFKSCMLNDARPFTVSWVDAVSLVKQKILQLVCELCILYFNSKSETLQWLYALQLILPSYSQEAAVQYV